jgi:hypothetical protein
MSRSAATSDILPVLSTSLLLSDYEWHTISLCERTPTDLASTQAVSSLQILLNTGLALLAETPLLPPVLILMVIVECQGEQVDWFCFFRD